jgi:hypothetical protein
MHYKAIERLSVFPLPVYYLFDQHHSELCDGEMMLLMTGWVTVKTVELKITFAGPQFGGCLGNGKESKIDRSESVGLRLLSTCQHPIHRTCMNHQETILKGK